MTVVSGKSRRLTLIECPNDINSMIDVAKVADLVLLLVDASFGFEMEIFEFLNICQVHGFPRIMGVLTHLDTFKNAKALQRTKKNLKQRFWTEVYQGAKLFYLSGMVHGKEYQKTEVHNLGRFISVMKFRPLVWRTTHPYLLADRLEDVTDPETLRKNEKCDRSVSICRNDLFYFVSIISLSRSVSVYGYLRGTMLKANQQLHLAGVGDFPINELAFLPDPCPLPEKAEKRKSLVEKDKSIYAPMSGVGGLVYDKVRFAEIRICVFLIINFCFRTRCTSSWAAARDIGRARRGRWWTRSSPPPPRSPRSWSSRSCACSRGLRQSPAWSTGRSRPPRAGGGGELCSGLEGWKRARKTKEMMRRKKKMIRKKKMMIRRMKMIIRKMKTRRKKEIVRGERRRWRKKKKFQKKW